MNLCSTKIRTPSQLWEVARQWTCLHSVCSVNARFCLFQKPALPASAERLTPADDGCEGLETIAITAIEPVLKMSLSRPSLTPKSSLVSSLSRISTGLYMPGSLQ